MASSGLIAWGIFILVLGLGIFGLGYSEVVRCTKGALYDPICVQLSDFESWFGLEFAGLALIIIGSIMLVAGIFRR